MDSPRKLTSADNSFETVFRSKTSGMNVFTKRISSVSVTGQRPKRNSHCDTTWTHLDICS
jgi:hypothetical protein